MQVKTYLARTLEKTESQTQYDNCAKTLASDKQILARILKHVLKEYQDVDVGKIEQCIEGKPEVTLVQIIKEPDSDTESAVVQTDKIMNANKESSAVQTDKIVGTNTESTTADEGTVYYDIRFVTYVPSLAGRVKILVNLELQKNYYQTYDLTTRGIFYCARMLSEQLDTEFAPTDYDDIKKVYSIWICTSAPEKAGNTISSYAVARNNIYGNFQEKERYDLLELIMIRLSEKEVTEQENQLLKMLTVLFSHSLTANEKKEYLKKEHGMRMTREVKGGIEEMCNLSFAIREEGIEQGRKEGVEQGRKEGVEQGRKEGVEQGRKEGVEQGHREGFKQGCKEGIQQGIDKIKQLVKCLNEANHSDLIPKLFSDDAFLKEMMQKYNIG